MDAAAQAPDTAREDPPAELERLRRRAYGPDADISGDAAAQARLAELEAREHAPSRTVVEADVVDSQPPAADAVKPQSQAPAPDSLPADDGAAPPPTRRRRRLDWAIAVVALTIVFASGVAVGAWWPGGADDRVDGPDATLTVSPATESRNPDWDRSLDFWGIARGSLVPHESFEGVGVWTARTPGEARCLVLTSGATIVTAACASAGLDPIFDLTIGRDLPAGQGTGLPAGTVMRFQARGDEVDVWVRAPAGQVVDGLERSSPTVSEPNRA